MTNEEAVKIIQTELECIKRNDGTDCDRDCAKCDLVMEDTDIKEALGMAIKALSQPEIIQCHECEQADFSGLHGGRLYCMEHGHYMFEDDFCNYGKEKRR